MAIQVTIDQERIAGFCRRHHVRRLALFGSVLREDFGPDSDVDVLVQFKDGYTPGWELFDLEDEVSIIIGQRVDLNTPGFLSRSFRQRVLDEALILHAA
ncbi:MAG: nucleotidyltransferase family protein [Chloroflexota bacterium]